MSGEPDEVSSNFTIFHFSLPSSPLLSSPSPRTPVKTDRQSCGVRSTTQNNTRLVVGILGAHKKYTNSAAPPEARPERGAKQNTVERGREKG